MTASDARQVEPPEGHRRNITEWTNESAIAEWGRDTAATRELMTVTDAEGDLPMQWLINPHLWRLLGDVAGKQVLDTGCGNGYLSRLPADLGAEVTGIEPADALYDYCVQRESALGQRIRCRQDDLSRAGGLDAEFDAVVCSMVLLAVPDWQGAMRT